MRNPSPPPTISLLLFIFWLLPFTSSAPPNNLSRGSSLSVEKKGDILVSPDNSFSCGFHNVGKNAFTFSIWFSNFTNVVVWTANRDLPVNGQGSRFTLRKDGTLVLMDVDGAVVWSSNTSSTPAERAQLLNTGNLVVEDPSGKILWQSFDSPTDTLLPTQPITKSTKLISAKANGSVSSGYYSFYFDNDNVLKLMYDGPEVSSIYWPDPDYKVWENGRTNYNSSRYGVLDEKGQFVASDKFAFNASDMGSGIRRRLTLDYDGNLRLYSFNELTGLWSVSWEALPQLCLVHGLCGRNGICVYTPRPECSCPTGYEMSDPSDWSQGCKPTFKMSCDHSQQMEFVELPKTDFWGFDLNWTGSLALETCQDLCRNDCSCLGITYKTGHGDCYTKSALFNGKTTPDFPGSAYLKLPRSIETPGLSVSHVHQPNCSYKQAEGTVGSSSVYQKSDSKTKWFYFYGFISAFGIIEIVFIATGWWFVFRREQKPASVEKGYRMILNQFRRFTYKELKNATGNFKDELGRGGSGAVYKGVLDDKRAAAVKKLEDVVQGKEEFWAEVGVIGRIYHMNLVRMYGFCSEGAHRLLVYEYVENLSLDKHLFNGHISASLLSWTERFKIAVGVAKGLAYLHHECLEWVIHCDVKPENILLDRDFKPKISDFGLAKLSRRGGAGSSLSRIRGTRSYMAPEWVSNLPITAKVDVYSYGVVLLEIVKGSRVSDCRVDEEEGVEPELIRLVRMLREKMGSEVDSWIADFVDSRLNGQFNCRQAAMMLEIAVSCLEGESRRRPSMESVVQIFLSLHDEGIQL